MIPSSRTTVAVVVPHYELPHDLELVLTALELQDHPLDLLEVVVADDGSATRPEPGPRPYRVSVVAQADEGFRAGAARNLGAAATTGEVLCFLDADTVPEPGYVSAVVRAVEAGADLVVGRRRHADLSQTSPEQLRSWLAGSAEGGGWEPEVFEEPAWLSEAYDRTDDLRSAGDDAYRFVISAVLSTTRALFEAVGGFEEAFSAYGGEDWELAHRCWLRGAAFRHARDAVAWHDGPDFAGRARDEDEARRSRNVEGLALARFVAGPATRGEASRGLVWEHPDVVVELDLSGAADGAEDADAVACARSLLAGSDAGVWLTGGSGGSVVGALDDPRVHAGEVPAAVLGRCRYRVHLEVPVLLEGATLAELTEVAPVRVGPHLAVRRARDDHRDDGAAVFSLEADGVSAEPARGSDLQRAFGHEDHQRTPRFSR
ncbi:glycosyltransferase [Quadrisphaera sp. INWT6]|uniref:glycosyltransferase n=1 Tax=Quadrisphaera sp. INWT6 TaxID=2596917 RepID=UPI001891F69D|nr:glycosyltransferase [Quadrisphaera sp. INWT6]MBF5082529.1 glycosyltransferase [Quadrisphaera sp. INWT6]